MTEGPCRAVRVRVPATSANLGPGFDSLGLGLGLYDEVVVRRGERGVRVAVTGEGADRVPRDGSHLVISAAATALAEIGEPVFDLELECTNRIPHGRGMGSSAAAIVAGMLAARKLVGDGERLPDEVVLSLASAMEGHPDNVAACLLGGLTIAWGGSGGSGEVSGAAGGGGGPKAVRLDPHPDIVTVLAVPRVEMSTKAARTLLPTAVPHRDAAANAARSALLLTALTSRPDLLLAGTEDRLHQDYRRSAMPETVGLVHVLRARGLAAAVSGAGPTVIVLTTRAEAKAAHKVVAGEVPDEWQVCRLEVDRAGAKVEVLP